MEDQIVGALRQPGIQPGELFEVFFGGMGYAAVSAVLFGVFRRVALEEALLPVGMSLEELALLLDQLMDLAESRPGRAEAVCAGEGEHV